MDESGLPNIHYCVLCLPRSFFVLCQLTGQTIVLSSFDCYLNGHATRNKKNIFLGSIELKHTAIARTPTTHIRVFIACVQSCQQPIIFPILLDLG